MSRRDSWLYWGLGLTGFLALVSYRPGSTKKPTWKGTGGAKVEGIGDGDVIHYFTETSGRIVVSTSAEDVSWSQPKLSDAVNPKFREMVRLWHDPVDEMGTEYRIPENHLWAIMWAESQGDPNAKSEKGAMGLMQVMPFHFKEGESPYDPRTNLRASCRYLVTVRAKVGNDLVREGSMYNAGGPFTNESWIASGRNPSFTTRWGYPAQPKYLDRVVAANNTFLSLGTSVTQA